MTIRAVTFDVYSALFDTHASLTEALRAYFHRRGIARDPDQAARAWREKQREYLLLANSLDREPASNRQAIEAAVRYALREAAPALPDADVHELTGAWERMRPWPEVAGVLAEFRRRALILAVLSNGDAAMLRALLAGLPVTFDAILSSEGGRFKPHPSGYRKALEQLGVKPDELFHVAGSPTDAMGATAAGIRTVWVNRRGEAVLDARFSPAHQAADLREALAIFDGLG